MVCCKDPENINIELDDNALKQVPKFKFLGSIFTEDGKNTEEIIQRITEAKKLCLLIKSNCSVRITLVWK
jgi:UDP-N-acetylglucosamine pyrophosphorylase